MVGSVGRVKGIPRPGVVTLQETFNLLSALGSGDERVKKILDEMIAVQDHNEGVLEAAKDAVVKADKREEEVVKQEAELARNLREAEELYARRLQTITNTEEELQRRGMEIETEANETSRGISGREDELRQKQEAHKESLRAGRLEFDGRERMLRDNREALRQLGSSIEDREQKINSDRIVLDDFQSELDERKAKLDERDARVHAAMEAVD